MVSDSKMPIEPEHKKNLGYEHYLYNMDDWNESLQPCEIDESELDKICKYLFSYYGIDSDELLNPTPIEITDIAFEKDGKIYFKQPTEQTKQVESDEENKEQIIKWIAQRIKDEERKHLSHDENWYEIAARKIYAIYNITLRNI